MRAILFATGLATTVAALAAPAAAAGAAGSNLAAKCGGCHQLEGPADAGLEARRQRKAPPLFYAGNKFREDWLVAWLQEPTRLRPAGDFPPAHAEAGPDGDVVAAAALPRHPALPPEQASAVAGQLMALRPHDDLIEREAYEPKSIPVRLGAMDFVKFKGCAACHKDTEKYGGLSGPELYSAWQRLQPAFIASYIRNPTAWEPRSLMPVKHLNDAAIQKLANYLKTIGEQKEKAK